MFITKHRISTVTSIKTQSNINKNQSNLAKDGIAARFYSPGGSNLQLQVLAGRSTIPLVIRDPNLTQCHRTQKCTCQMASNSVERFKQGTQVWQTTDRQTDTLWRNGQEQAKLLAPQELILPKKTENQPKEQTTNNFYSASAQLTMQKPCLSYRKDVCLSVCLSVCPSHCSILSQRLLHLFGTVCRSQYVHRHYCKFFAADWRPSFLPGHTAALTKSVSLHWLPRDFTVILTCYVSLQS